MAREIDEKVVKMSFDNSNFEKNVKTTMSTLDKLKTKLKFGDIGGDGLRQLSLVGNSIKFEGLSSAVERVSEKFEKLGFTGTAAMWRISRAIADTAIDYAKMLSVDNVLKGWQKLEGETTAVATLVSQGNELAYVETQLEKLNWFTDETSYNFTDMINNIAKFTATGKKLDESVTAMQGIALWAAASGQNAQKASSAMYQLAQALGAGVMRREDYRSIQNVNMDTDEFRQKALDTAVALGTLKKVGEDTYRTLNNKTFKKSQFAEQLTEGQWFNSDVMMEVYKLYSKAADQLYNLQNKLNNEFDLDIITTQLIRLKDVLDKDLLNGTDKFSKEAYNLGIPRDSIDSVREMVKQLDAFGMKTLKAGQEYRTFRDVVDATQDAVSSKWKAVFKDIVGNYEQQKELWSNIGESFYDIFATPIDNLHGLMREWNTLGGRDSLLNALTNVFEALGSVLKPIKEAFRDIFPETTAQRLLELTKRFEKFTSKLKVSEQVANKIRSTFKGLFSLVDIGITVVGKLVGVILKLLKPFGSLVGIVIDSTGSFGDWLSKIRDAIKQSTFLDTVLNKIYTSVKRVTDAIVKFFKENAKLDKLVTTIKNVVKIIFNGIKKIFGAIIESMNTTEVKEGLEILNSGLLSGVLAALQRLLTNLANLVSQFRKTSVTFRQLMDDLRDCLYEYQKTIKARVIMTIAKAVALLAVSLLLLSTIEPDKLAQSLGALTTAFMELMGALWVFGKIENSFDELNKDALALVGLAFSLTLVAKALKTISTISPDRLVSSLVGIGLALQIMIHAMKQIPLKDIKKSYGALITLSIGLIVLGVAMKQLAKMSWEEIARSLVSMAFALGILIGAMHLVPSKEDHKKIGGLITAALAMVVLASALKILSSISWSGIARGLVGMAGAMTILIIGLNLLNTGNKISARMGIFKSYREKHAGGLSKSFALLGAAMSMVMLAGVLKILATMSWDAIARSLVAMTVSLGLLVAALRILGNNSLGSLAGSGALLITATSLVVLATALKILGSMSWGNIIRAMVALAGAFIIIGGAAVLLGPVITTIVALSGAMLVFGIAALALGAGLTLIGAGIAAIIAGIAGGAAALVAGLATIIKGILQLVPDILKIVYETIVMLCKVIGECAPMIVETVLKVVLELIKALDLYIPEIGEYLFKYIIKCIRLLSDHMPEIILAIFELFGSIYHGVVDAMNLLDPEAILKGSIAIGILVGVLYAFAGLTSIAGPAAIGIAAFAGLMILLSGALALLGKLSTIPGLKEVIGDGGSLLEAIANAIGKFVGGLVAGFTSSASKALPVIAENLSEFMIKLEGFLNGIKNIDLLMVPRIMILYASMMMFAAADFVAGMMKIFKMGGNLPNLANDLSSFMTNLSGFIEGSYKIQPDLMERVVSLGKAIMYLVGSNLLNNLSKKISIFTGNNSLENFAKEIVKLGAGIRGFVDELGILKPMQLASLSVASKAVVLLADASRQIPNSGGVAGFFAGENDPDVWGKQLPVLGAGLKLFVAAVGKFNQETLDTVKFASEAVVLLSKAGKEIPNSGGLLALVTGDNDISKFGFKLVLLGGCLKAFTSILSKFDEKSVKVVGFAADSITLLAKASKEIPNSGGMVTLFTGDNDIAVFGLKMPIVAKCLSNFVDNLGEYNADSVDKASLAAQTISLLANAGDQIPNSGGMVSLFTGDNDIADFSEKMPTVGLCLKLFTMALSDFNKDKVEIAKYAGEAIVALSEAGKNVPASGGMKQLFTGTNDISAYSKKLPILGLCLRLFISSIGDFKEESIQKVKYAGEAITALVQSTSAIPNKFGLLNILKGNNDITGFSVKLPILGFCLKQFLNAIKGMKEEDVSTVEIAGKAITALTSSTSTIEKTGGLKQLFEGESDISKFAFKLPILGLCLKTFASMVKGFSEDQITDINNAMTAVTSIVGIASKLPPTGGLKQLYEGENDISKFSFKLISTGLFLRLFAKSVSGLTEDDVKKIGYASTAISSMASASANIQPTGGLKQLMEGVSNIAKFGQQLASAGKSIFNFADSVKELPENTVTQVGLASEALAVMSNASEGIKNTGFFASLFKGDNDVGTFADKMPKVGKGLHDFISNLKTFTETELNTVKIASDAMIALSKMSVIDSKKVNKKFEQLEDVGKNIAHFITQLVKFDEQQMGWAKNNVEKFVEILDKFDDINTENIEKLNKNIKNIAEKGINDLCDALADNNAQYKIINSITTIINTMIKALEDKRKDVKDKFKSILETCYNGMVSSDIKTKFKDLGKSFAEGFANGIDANRHLAYIAGQNLGKASLNGTKIALDSHSPSKEAHKLGGFFGLGFVGGIKEYTSDVYTESYNMASEAKRGLSKAISTLSDIIDGNIDTQPTIRPVLDLSDVTSNASRLNNMFNNVGIGANLNAISKGMNGRIQNDNSDVISAIDKLGKTIGSRGDTYNINGVTYDDQSAVSEAVRILIRAANIERRV